MTILLYAALALGSTAVVWVGSELLEKAASRLGAFYQLPPVVQGAVIAAVGSSFPELSTTVLAALLHGDFELGVAAIAGSAIFNILVIPGVAGLVSRGQLESNRDLVYKEAQFYMVSVAVLLLTFSFAVIYYPVEGRALTGVMTREFALIPVCLYGLYIFIQYQDTMDYEVEAEPGEVRAGAEWLRLVAGLAIILVGVEGLVRSAIAFGELLNTPSFLWGATVVAAATSIPDAFVSIQASRAGRGVTSIANVLGSNIFDLLVAIPAGVLIAGAAPVDYAVAAPMMAVLTMATVILFWMMRTHMVLKRWESWTLLALYVVFVVWITLETFGVFRWALP